MEDPSSAAHRVFWKACALSGDLDFPMPGDRSKDGKKASHSYGRGTHRLGRYDPGQPGAGTNPGDRAAAGVKTTGRPAWEKLQYDFEEII